MPLYATGAGVRQSEGEVVERRERMEGGSLVVIWDDPK